MKFNIKVKQEDFDKTNKMLSKDDKPLVFDNNLLDMPIEQIYEIGELKYQKIVKEYEIYYKKVSHPSILEKLFNEFYDKNYNKAKSLLDTLTSNDIRSKKLLYGLLKYKESIAIVIHKFGFMSFDELQNRLDNGNFWEMEKY